MARILDAVIFNSDGYSLLKIADAGSKVTINFQP
jgi:hypothetical protein